MPLWIEDGGDGWFGPGDRLEFVGEQLHGDHSYFHDYAALNVYRLDASGPAVRMQRPAATSTPASVASAAYRGRLHLEEDRVLLRLPEQGDETAELWYWLKLTHLDKRPEEVRFDLPGLEPRVGESATLELRFRGWSAPRRSDDASDHRVEVSLNGQLVGVAEWDGQAEYRLAVDSVPEATVRPAANTLSLRVPVRAPGGEELIDVVMLNSVEVDYPRSAESSARQTRLWLDRQGPRPLAYALRAPAGRELVLYTSAGGRLDRGARAVNRGEDVGAVEYVFSSSGEAGAGADSLYVVADHALLRPAAVVLDQPSQLRETGNRADYLMLVHARLQAALEPLARLHRERGLAVEVVEIQDVYDEFSHGVIHPRAIRDFIDYAYHHWQPPHPRFVLLVGDASWDTKNREVVDQNYPDWTYVEGGRSRFVKNESTPYPAGAELNLRALIPTWNYGTGQGHSASDNWFVSVDGDDFYPDLAIGRLPITEPAELAAIIDKTASYLEEPEVGPWRRRLLWITNDEQHFQNQSGAIEQLAAQRGYQALEVFPRPEEPDNRVHQQRLRAAFDEGVLLVHFLGHGGRYIWRTGPPAHTKNHDLFTLADLDQLQPSRRLPLVLSMTCYSAPFDHPNADSIGEKLLRLEHRGAVAVLAASWRNTPTTDFSKALVQELTRPGAGGATSGGTVGEAIARAKRQIRNRILIEQYNLLGDPALPLAAPANELALEAAKAAAGKWQVSGGLAVPEFEGRVLIEWLDGAGGVLAQEEQTLAVPRFSASLEPERGAAVAVRAYMWDAQANVDGLGYAPLLGDPVVAVSGED